MATMNPAAIDGVPYQVPPEPSRASSIAMALAVHAGLLGFLWAGISWQNTPPVAVEAEVWDMQTQQAAPEAPPEAPPEPVRPPEPAPVPKVTPKVVDEPVTPKPPDIALERLKEQKKKLLEKKLAEEKLAKELADEKARELADKKAKEKADKLAKAALEAADKKKLDKLRDDEMKRLTSQAGGAGTAKQSTAPRIDTGYIAAIVAKIDRETKWFDGDREVPGNRRVEFHIEQLPTGEIISIRKTKSSGVPAFDEAVERGITAASPLPKKKDGTVERSIQIGIKMK